MYFECENWTSLESTSSSHAAEEIKINSESILKRSVIQYDVEQKYNEAYWSGSLIRTEVVLIRTK